MKSIESNLINFVPLPYRKVSVQNVPIDLASSSVLTYLLGKDSYMATEYCVLHNSQNQYAIARVEKKSTGPLFGTIEKVELIAGPDRCLFIKDSSVDTGVPSALAQKAFDLKIKKDQTLIVEGAYGHINFIHHPEPRIIEVVDLIPPEPSRLFDPIHLAILSGNFGPLVFVKKFISIQEVADSSNQESSIFPCRVSGLKSKGKTLFLDERPQVTGDEILVGCERSSEIYEHFYSNKPKRIDTCPKNLAKDTGNLVLLRCCAFQDSILCKDRRAMVPWGCNIQHVTEALKYLSEQKN